MLSIKLDPEVVSKDDVEMLQDLIVAATNDAHRKVDEALAEIQQLELNLVAVVVAVTLVAAADVVRFQADRYKTVAAVVAQDISMLLK